MPYDNTNRGSIWKNGRKVTENDPDFTGTFTNEAGEEYWISAWKRKEGDNPKGPALKMSMRRKEPMQAAAAPTGAPYAERPQAATTPVVDEFDPQIPF